MDILIVDDSRVALQLLKHALTANGYHVLTATDGRQALQIVQERQCRLIISDWEMPTMSGLELCREVRRLGGDDYVYIILVTSRNRTCDTVEGLEAGADDFVSKPFEPDELLARVRAGERILNLETRDLTIFALAKLAEERDPETGAHLERVRSYSRILAQHMAADSRYAGQINSEFIRLIYLTSPLHDIGKVAVPDAVLLKPGKLTADEFRVMQTHTVRGAATLEAALARYPSAKYLQMARDIALSHHEQYAGGGYPQGLQGEEIPLAARVVAVADVYDALTSKRVYKAAFDHQLARAVIKDGSGTQFDPGVVDAFFDTEAEIVEIRRRFTETMAFSGGFVPSDAPRASAGMDNGARGEANAVAIAPERPSDRLMVGA